MPLLHAAPAVGFDQPFEMLEACHERVQRSLALLARLIAHIDGNGHDEQSRAAARDVLRYFDLAAPHHHEDEERHVFPRLLAVGDAALAADVQRLRADHLRMAALWGELRIALQGWAADGAAGPIDAASRATAGAFRAAYDGHIELEEGRVFPAARGLTDTAAAAAMGEEMAARRQVG
jgi:hemerythrin-like domain-containing protein